jgi:hypothetical protein
MPDAAATCGDRGVGWSRGVIVANPMAELGLEVGLHGRLQRRPRPVEVRNRMAIMGSGRGNYGRDGERAVRR